MGLQLYHKKRKFDVTPEPRGQVGRSKGHTFVIQKHAARRLHYDLRLELDGVMKSWAVTKGPSLVPGEKRLAIHVEDHPIEYNKFEGTIPQGEYGGGTVMIWDRGKWIPEGDPHRAYEKGHLDFTLEGTKLHGRWHLVRMHSREREGKEPWLLIKARDDAARGPDDPDILEEKPLSVASGRSMPEIAQGKGKKRVWHSNRPVKENFKALLKSIAPKPAKTARARAATRDKSTRATRKKSAKRTEEDSPGARAPAFVPPSLATLRAEPPSGSEWVHEIKFDGYRIQAQLANKQVRLLTRKGLDWTSKFPNIEAAVAALPARSALLDGEVVIEDGKGISSFSGLQAALKAGEADTFIYYVFDLLYLDGRDLLDQTLIERKAALQQLIPRGAQGPVRYSEHFGKSGQVVLDHACKIGLEGIVSKRKDAPYRSGRFETFIKTKCANEQEFVVGGYSPSTAMYNAIGALVVGYYQDKRLLYAGRIGTGYTHATARELWRRLNALQIERPPFDEIPREEARRKDVRWVKPTMVIESHFRGWTADNLVRQAAFKGVREDKPPEEVVREVPVMAHRGTSAPKRSHNEHEAAKLARSPRTGAEKSDDVRLTHPERVYWLDVGVTKADLANYYRAVWRWMAPQLIGRPLAMVRCPDGTKGECFFQKHASAGLSEKNLKMVIDKNRRQVLAVEDLEGLLSLVQAGVLEVHVRGSRIERLDICNRIVFDIDPGEDVEWREVLGAARDVRARLAALELLSFVKLSGGKGLHVVLPTAGTDWDTTKRFAGAVASAMQRDDPDRYVLKMTKSLRRGKIFIDYFRNSLEQTSICAYSTRARAGAPVSAPVSWEELGRTKCGNQYTVLNLGKRLDSLKQDPWKEMDRLKQKLPDARQLRQVG
jgi:bifunctional non-homologous end joining protein LigD